MTERPRSNIGLKRPLIAILSDLETIKSWINDNGYGDEFSSIILDMKNNNLPTIAKDILLLEDRRYFRHRGAEFRAIFRLIRRYIRVRKIGGISTIEQQLVRTIRKRRERSLSRKTSEITLSILINFHFSKINILTSYLNSAYFGPHMHGVDTASLIVFGKKPRHLDKRQSAFIACLLPTPIPVNVAEFLWENGPVKDRSEILDSFSRVNPWWVNSMKTRISVLEAARARYSRLFS